MNEQTKAYVFSENELNESSDGVRFFNSFSVNVCVDNDISLSPNILKRFYRFI